MAHASRAAVATAALLPGEPTAAADTAQSLHQTALVTASAKTSTAEPAAPRGGEENGSIVEVLTLVQPVQALKAEGVDSSSKSLSKSVERIGGGAHGSRASGASGSSEGIGVIDEGVFTCEGVSGDGSGGSAIRGSSLSTRSGKARRDGVPRMWRSAEPCDAWDTQWVARCGRASIEALASSCSASTAMAAVAWSALAFLLAALPLTFAAFAASLSTTSAGDVLITLRAAFFSSTAAGSLVPPLSCSCGCGSCSGSVS